MLLHLSSIHHGFLWKIPKCPRQKSVMMALLWLKVSILSIFECLYFIKGLCRKWICMFILVCTGMTCPTQSGLWAAAVSEAEAFYWDWDWRYLTRDWPYYQIPVMFQIICLPLGSCSQWGWDWKTSFLWLLIWVCHWDQSGFQSLWYISQIICLTL